jgi:hypothetical protein
MKSSFFKIAILSIFTLLLNISNNAQEINCQVTVIAPTLKSDPANTEIIESMQSSVYEFINNTKWTDDEFKDEEKIQASVMITINSKTGSSNFSGTIQISSSRPTYNSDYDTRLFNWNDEQLTFEYQRGAALIFTPDRHQNNLADVVAFYMYMVIGYDYDSFSLKGGTPYFIKAQQIVSNCQNAPERGWKPTDGKSGKRNRFRMVDNAMNNAFDNLRKCFYTYHRDGMDRLYEDSDKAIDAMVESLKSLEIIHKTQPNSINVQAFFAAKADEIVALFSETPAAIKNKVYLTVTRLDPGNISKYNKMKK